MFIVAAVLVLAAPATVGAAKPPGTPVPAGFVGMNLDGPVVDPAFNVALSQQFDMMKSNGVQSIRVVFDWSGAQPYESWTDVPPDQTSNFVTGAGNVPTNFTTTDQIVGLAAARGITVVPTVIYTPKWDAGKHVGNSLIAPKQYAPYGEFLQTLITRYGRNGTFWQQNPGIAPQPISMWEVWNEPWIPYYWPVQPFMKSYLQLLRVAHAAIKAADPSAKVVLGGMPNASWQVLTDLYKIRGANRLFDVVDIHAYTEFPQGVIKILRLDRAVMTAGGDGRKPMILGEMGWTSSLHKTHHLFDWETTRAGQAQQLSLLLPLLAAYRSQYGLLGFYWYTWMGDEGNRSTPWNFSGLLAYRKGHVSEKPALAAFQREARLLEHG